MSIYSKARIKVTIITVLICMSIIVGSWLLLFVTDYIMFKNNMPILFSVTKVEERNGEYITLESGLGYYVIIYGDNTSELYLFNRKIK